MPAKLPQQEQDTDQLMMPEELLHWPKVVVQPGNLKTGQFLILDVGADLDV